MIPILKHVEVGDYSFKIALIQGWSKQRVFYCLGKLQKAELVRCKIRSNVVFYELTRKGQDIDSEAVKKACAYQSIKNCKPRLKTKIRQKSLVIIYNRGN